MALFTTNTETLPLPWAKETLTAARAIWITFTTRPQRTPEETLAANTRREAARARVDNLLR